MSAGAFLNTKYEASYATPFPIHPIRIQPETEALADENSDINEPPTGSITNFISANVKRGAKAYGLKPRGVILRFPNSGQPAGYKPGGTTFVPILRKSFFDNLEKDDLVDYLNSVCTIVSKRQESVL